VSSAGSLRRPLLRYVDARVESWRSGSSEGQARLLVVLLLATAALFVGAVTCYGAFPTGCFLLPIVVGGLLLRWKPLVVLTAVAVAAALTASLLESAKAGFPDGRIGTLVVIGAVAIIQVYAVRLNRSELPAQLGQAVLAELRDRLQEQGTIPPLPEGWRAEQLIRSAGGTSYAGDFMVADLNAHHDRLEVILVDVWGKGVTAGTKSLQLAGALGGLIGSAPPLGLLTAVNDYLLRQRWADGFATAVHVAIELDTGRYTILSAGHPPALRWRFGDDEWTVDDASGTALGVTESPEFQASSGRLEPGSALLFYTDGLVESRDRDLVEGITGLQRIARSAIRSGFAGAATRILDRVPSSDDDRAVLVLERCA